MSSSEWKFVLPYKLISKHITEVHWNDNLHHIDIYIGKLFFFCVHRTFFYCFTNISKPTGTYIAHISGNTLIVLFKIYIYIYINEDDKKCFLGVLTLGTIPTAVVTTGDWRKRVCITSLAFFLCSKLAQTKQSLTLFLLFLINNGGSLKIKESSGSDLKMCCLFLKIDLTK